MSDIDKLKQLIDSSKNIVVITGAGISTPSGIPDIRSANGAANNKDLIKKYGYDYETIVSHSFFNAKTDEFYRYYKEQMIFKNAKPNKAHMERIEDGIKCIEIYKKIPVEVLKEILV